MLNDETITRIAADYGVTPAQIILRWHLQNDVLVIPKSVTPSRIKENSEVFHFELTEATMQEINSLNRNERFGQSPDSFKFDF